MSIKDDFLEALKSVKKDFFKEYETPENPGRAEPEPQFSQIFSGHDAEPLTDPVPPPYRAENDQGGYGADDGPNGGYPDELHSDELDDEDAFAPDVDPTPYRTAEPDPDDDAIGGDDGGVNDEPPRDGRMIFDDNNGAYSDDRTIISRNTVIRGALQTEDSVRMFGQILGDIDCKSNILVAGRVRGNTSAANAYVIDAQVDGNLLCDDVINITDDAWILGNIRAQQAEIDGKIKGNIEIRHTISIGPNSSVIGNISTDELEIKRGAFVNGQIMMYSPSRDVIDRFDQFEK